MKNIFITATNTDVGKTYTTLQLIETLGRRGLKPGVFKPVETGVNDYPSDAKILHERVQKVNSTFAAFTLEDICPIQLSLPAAPYVAAEGDTIDFALIEEKYRKLKKACDILLIEGAGGLLVPLRQNYFVGDLIALFDAVALLVTHDRLGCINDTLLNLFYLHERGIDAEWCVNLRNPEHFLHITDPFYRAYFQEYYTLQKDLGTLTDRLLSR